MNTETKLSFMSWNSNGLVCQKKRLLKKSEIKKHNCDVVFLQETHTGESEVFEVLDDYKSFFTIQTQYKGVAILIKNNILEETTIVKQIKDPAGCYILLKCILKGKLFTLMSVYSCHIDIKPLLKLRSVLEEHAEGILLIGGDFNVALNPYLDTVSTERNINHIHFRPIVKELMTSFHLVDVWRRFHPTDRQYSYEQKSRLDYIFVPEESMQYIEKNDISLEKSCSDHHQIVFKISICNEEYKEPEFCMDITTKETKMHILIFPMTAVNKWLSCKCKCWTELDLTKDLNTSLMISASEVERAIQSLIANHVKRPDGLPVSFYKSNSYVLIPYLCAFYHNVLEQPTNIPEAFNETIEVSENHYIFNVDYLILATIMARWLNDHLQSHSTDYIYEDNKKKVKKSEITQVLITFRKHPRKVEVMWSVLNDILKKEQDEDTRNPPLLDKFEIKVLQRILINSPKVNYKLLYWGCPLTPLLITLFFKHFADELVENVKKPKLSIHISKENVIVRFSVNFKKSLFEHLGKKCNVTCIEF